MMFIILVHKIDTGTFRGVVCFFSTINIPQRNKEAEAVEGSASIINLLKLSGLCFPCNFAIADRDAID